MENTEKVNEQSKKDKNIKNYRSNSPISDERTYGIYCNALDEKIKEEDVFNIGIIAPYGAGKSSLIKTYKERNKESKFHTISLAMFNSNSEKKIDKQNKKNGKSTESYEDDKESEKNGKLVESYGDNKESKNDIVSRENRSAERNIELAILQQMVYSKRSSRFPNSKVERIKNKGFKDYLGYVLTFLSFFIFIFGNALYFYGNINSVKIVYICFLALALGTLFYYALTGKLRFRKVILFDIEAEFKEDSNLSILNRFIDEIIYFFSKTKIDVLILEDLDRFNSLEIFTKLREVNQIINNSEMVKQKVTFIYCIKDDMFSTNLERAKFFEFIISLVPVLGPQNVNDILNEYNSSFGDKSISEELINNTKFFIDDYRLLNNTINDYKMYWNVLGFTGKEKNKNDKLFSMMLYKNKLPEDFANLNFNRGVVANTFKNKNKYIYERVEEIKQLIQDLKDKNDEYEQSYSVNYTLLRDIISCHIMRYSMGQRSYNQQYFIIENSSQLPEEGTMIYTKNQNGYYSYSTLKELNKHTGLDYYFWEKVAKEGKEKLINKNNALIDRYEQDIRNFKLKTIKQLLNDYSITLDSEVSPLLEFLISNGYIEEDYLDYTVNSTNEINGVEKEYIANVLTNKTNNYDLDIVNFKSVLNNLSPSRFNTLSCLNNNLFYELFNIIRDRKYCDNIISFLNNNTVENKEFIKQYYETYSIDNLIDELIDKYNLNIKDILSDSGFDFSSKLVKVIMDKKNEIIDYYNKGDILTNIISNANVNLLDIKEENILTIVKEIGVKYTDLSGVHYDEAEIIISNSLYAIKENNLKKLLDINGKKFSLSNIYLYLNNEYIKENIDLVIDELKPKLGDENEDVIKEILNLDSIHHQAQLIEKLEIQFTNISGLKKDTLKLMVEKNLFVPNWNNLDVLSKSDVDFNLKEYTEKNESILINDNSLDQFDVRYVLLSLENLSEKILDLIEDDICAWANEFKDDNIAYLIEKGIEVSSSTYHLIDSNNFVKTILLLVKKGEMEFDICDLNYSSETLNLLFDLDYQNEFIERYISKYESSIISDFDLLKLYSLCKDKLIKLTDNIYVAIIRNIDLKSDMFIDLYEKISNKSIFTKEFIFELLSNKDGIKIEKNVIVCDDSIMDVIYKTLKRIMKDKYIKFSKNRNKMIFE